MDSIQTICLIGFILFGLASTVALSVYIYFAYTGRRAAARLSNAEWDIKWSKSLWIYYFIIMAHVLMAILYMAQYLGVGFSVKPGLLVVTWLRWVILAVTSGLMTGCFSYVLTRKPHSGQSFFCTLLYIFAILFLLAATLSQSNSTRLLWFFVSILSFLASLSLVFFPENRFRDKDYYAIKDILFSEKPCVSDGNLLKLYAYSYRWVVFMQLVLVYPVYLVIWLLSDVNEFTSVISFKSAMIAYLVFDCLSLMPFALYLIILTFRHRVTKLEVKDRADGSSQMFASTHNGS